MVPYRLHAQDVEVEVTAAHEHDVAVVHGVTVPQPLIPGGVMGRPHRHTAKALMIVFALAAPGRPKAVRARMGAKVFSRPRTQSDPSECPCRSRAPCSTQSDYGSCRPDLD